ncbi:hypothetical protein ABH926_008792 [Catenulispora sp. GP43]|uniref:lanthionine synthetase C family protein n=1 Tax=Catenulispora sp. GP43 TaxID=3156263 RepID=UPI003511FF2E
MKPQHQALAEGELGIALLHAQRGDIVATRACLKAAIAGGVSTGGNASLFHGAPALEFVLRCAGRPLTDVTEATDHVVRHRLVAARERRESGARPALAEFDLIRGLTGLGALLLARDTGGRLLNAVLAYLVELAQPVQHTDGRQLPGWWCDTGPDDKALAGGHGNNGVAHGIAGPLALMSLAARAGIVVEGQIEAIGLCFDWLEQHGGFYWLTRDQLEEHRPAAPSRPSWCYGALGIVRARQLAAIALGDNGRRKAAEVSAVVTLSDHSMINRLTIDAGLCHGWAGQLAVTRAIAVDSAEPDRFARFTAYLEAKTSAGLDALTKPGFLDGRAGAELALAGTDMTGWTRALLIN